MMARKLAPACTLVASIALAGCGGGPSESDFVDACTKGPEPLGGEEMCECFAAGAKEHFSPEHFALAVRDMQGDGEGVQAVAASWTFEERAEFAQQQMRAMQNCIELLDPTQDR